MEIVDLSDSAVFCGPFSKTNGLPTMKHMRQITDRVKLMQVGSQLLLSFWRSGMRTPHYCVVVNAQDHDPVIRLAANAKAAAKSSARK